MVQPEVSSRLTGIFPSDSHQMQFTGNGQIVGVFPLILWGLPYNIKQLEVSVVVNSYYVNKIEFSSPAVCTTWTDYQSSGCVNTERQT